MGTETPKEPSYYEVAGRMVEELVGTPDVPADQRDLVRRELLATLQPNNKVDL